MNKIMVPVLLFIVMCAIFGFWKTILISIISISVILLMAYIIGSTNHIYKGIKETFKGRL